MSRNSSLAGTVIGLGVVMVVLGVVLLYQSAEEEKYTGVCEEQGYTTFRIGQYASSDIFLCADRDGVLRVPPGVSRFNGGE